jgi:hypothetical protein
MHNPANTKQPTKLEDMDNDISTHVRETRLLGKAHGIVPMIL